MYRISTPHTSYLAEAEQKDLGRLGPRYSQKQKAHPWCPHRRFGLAIDQENRFSQPDFALQNSGVREIELFHFPPKYG